MERNTTSKKIERKKDEKTFRGDMITLGTNGCPLAKVLNFNSSDFVSIVVTVLRKCESQVLATEIGGGNPTTRLT